MRRPPASPPARKAPDRRPASLLQQRKQQVVRDAISDAAVDLFAAKGFDETTVDDIARAAGVSRRSFFRYFSSKSDLMAQDIVNYANSLVDAIDACPRSMPLGEVVRETVVEVARRSAERPRARTVMRIAAKYPAAREAQLSRLSELQDRVAAAFARRCRKSERRLAPGALAGVALSALAVAFRTWFEQGEADIARTAGEVFATVRRLLCGPQPEAPGKRRRAGRVTS